MVTSDTEAKILSLLHRMGPLSRQQIHDRLGLRPNTVGLIAGQLIDRGILAEGSPQAIGPGRPRVPLQIDENQCWVVGLALKPGSVTGCRVNLRGQRVGRVLEASVATSESVTQIACDVLEQLQGGGAVAVGVSTTGLLDAQSHTILFSSALPDRRPTSVQPLFDAAGGLPIRIDNDMRALATRWQLARPAPPQEDLLLVYLRDGAIGASLMIDGKPNRGCVVGGNELGFTHLPVGVSTMKLEDIFSSNYLQNLDPSIPGGLAERVARFDAHDKALLRVTDLLGLALANAANFVRPHRLVLASDLTRHTRFYHALLGAMRRTLLGPIGERMRVDPWDDPLPEGAEAAAWLALDMVFHGPAVVD